MVGKSAWCPDVAGSCKCRRAGPWVPRASGDGDTTPTSTPAALCGSASRKRGHAIEIRQPRHPVSSPDRILGPRQPARFVECAEKYVDVASAVFTPEQVRATRCAELARGALGRAIAHGRSADDRELLGSAAGKSGHRRAGFALALGAVTDAGVHGRARHRIANRAAQTTTDVLVAHPSSMRASIPSVNRCLRAG
jgi:hypothetical protein